MSPRALAATLPRVTKPVLEKHGRAYASLIGEWANIVGPTLAAVSLPEKLANSANATGGVLTVRVAGAAATEFQHLAPQILDRINTYLGFGAVARLKLVQAPLPGPQRRRPAPRPVRPSAAARQAIATATDTVSDPALHDALVRFGEAIAAHDSPEPRRLGPAAKEAKRG